MSARYGRKLDANHAQLVEALRLFGADVETIQGAAGAPDLIVKVFGLERLAEVKMPGEDLNDAQRVWWGKWGRAPTILRTVEDCAALVAELRGLMSRSEVHQGEAP